MSIAVAIGLAAVRLHRAHQLAGALRHLRRLGVGRAHQRRRQRRLARIEPVRRLAEKRARQCIDADDLAAERHGVEVGLQDLVLAPAALQPLRRDRLAELLRQAAAAAAAPQVVVEQAGELHRDRRGAARARVPQVAPGRGGHRAPVDAAVFVEALVFAQHHRRAQGRRDVGQGDPLAASHGARRCARAAAARRRGRAPRCRRAGSRARTSSKLASAHAGAASTAVSVGSRKRKVDRRRGMGKAPAAHGDRLASLPQPRRARPIPCARRSRPAW